MRALVYIVRNVSGRGVSEGVDPFSTPLSALDGLVSTPVVVRLRARRSLAGIVGVGAREPVPVVWAVAALATRRVRLCATRRTSTTSPRRSSSPRLPLLWLLQRTARADAAPRVADRSLRRVAGLGQPLRRRSGAGARSPPASASAKQYVDAHLGPERVRARAVVLAVRGRRATSSSCRSTSAHSPDYPYRYLPTTAACARTSSRADATALLHRPAASDLTAESRSSSATSAGIPSSRVRDSWQRSSRSGVTEPGERDRYAAERQQGELRRRRLEHAWGWSSPAGRIRAERRGAIPDRAARISGPASAASSSAAARASSPPAWSRVGCELVAIELSEATAAVARRTRR